MTFSPASVSQALGLKACSLTCQVDGPGHLISILILTYQELLLNKHTKKKENVLLLIFNHTYCLLGCIYLFTEYVENLGVCLSSTTLFIFYVDLQLVFIFLFLSSNTLKNLSLQKPQHQSKQTNKKQKQNKKRKHSMSYCNEIFQAIILPGV